MRHDIELARMLIGTIFAALLTLPGVPAPGHAQSAAAREVKLEVRGDGLAPTALTAGDLASLPRVEVRATAHGNTALFSGVRMADMLRLAGVPIDSVRGRRAALYVLVSAADGYSAVFSLGELAPDLTGRMALLADQRDGAPLDDEEGPLRLVLPDESRPTRWVRQVTSISVRQAKP